MHTGAVIVAAGMSTRMRQFKQLMKVGELTMAQRVVVNFQRAGISDIVVVTGCRAAEVEDSLASFGVRFVRNEAYETTQMLDSARLGLQALQNTCDRIFFCPVDIPLFTVRTVRSLMQIKAPLVIPVCGEKRGHPIVISSQLIPGILAYDGEGGLKGALNMLAGQPVYLEVEDRGAVTDADTQEDYRHLQDMLQGGVITPDVQTGLRLRGGQVFFTAETAMLLRGIENLGNVRDACINMSISYSKGWNLIHRITERQTGGKDGGLAYITPYGMDLLTRFEQLQKDTERYGRNRCAEIFAQDF